MKQSTGVQLCDLVLVTECGRGGWERDGEGMPCVQVGMQDQAGDTALHTACGFGNLIAARALVRHGADVSARNARGHTPLWSAVANETSRAQSQGSLVAFLLERGCTFDAQERDENGADILTVALTHSDHASAAALLKQARIHSASRAVSVTDTTWLAAASHATVDSPLLKELPADHACAVAALRTAWQRARAGADIAGEAPALDFTDLAFRQALGQLVNTEASALLRRMCKGAALRCTGATYALQHNSMSERAHLVPPNT